ncbi:MAG TPA: DUF1778 domain-containing protein [Oculatellaceae cyanobacterium]
MTPFTLLLYALKVYGYYWNVMPRKAVEDNQRMSLRMPTAVKSRIARAAALCNADLTNFVTQAALREANAVIEDTERLRLSEASYMRLLDLLEKPPAPNAKLIAAAKSMPRMKS